MYDHRKRNFILQQGFEAPAPRACPVQYSALQFQPRVVGLVVPAGIILQEPAIFLALSVVLGWNAALPRWNPFEALYNATLGARPGAVRLSPAPAPRRFAQGMAATFALAIAGSLWLDCRLAAYVLEALLAAAVAALTLGGFCFGSFIFTLLRGRASFAVRTLPWIRSEARAWAPSPATLWPRTGSRSSAPGRRAAGSERSCWPPGASRRRLPSGS